MSIRTIALIGSFRQHYDPIQRMWRFFTDNGLHVTSPKGAAILENNIPFVRFETDPNEWDDPTVQTVALHRILRADLTYVVAPEGYVGRTTCYEIGRIIQAGRPLYFSEPPHDLPVRIPADRILTPDRLLATVRAPAFRPTAMYAEPADSHQALEADLLRNRFHDDTDLKTHEAREGRPHCPER
jgi:hypothetical protein